MGVRVLFLGPLAEIAPSAEMEADAPLNWSALLALAGEQCAAQLNSERVNVACAGKVLLDKTMLDAQDGDEVAVLPPVSGG